jgi:hypothetical protein
MPKSNSKSTRLTGRSADQLLLPRGQVAPFPREQFERFLQRVKIQSRDFKGRITVKLLGTQRYILDEIEKALAKGITTIVILKGRQQGASTILYLIDLFWGFSNPGLLGTFILHEESALDKWRANIEVSLDSMPLSVSVAGKRKRFRPKTIKHNRNILLFENDTSFSYLIAGTSENKAGGIGRSQAFNYVHATECAMYGNEEDIKAFRSSVSAIYAHRLQIWESTAKGYNHFYDMCQDAKTSPAVHFIFSGWWRDERCQFHSDDFRFEHYGRDRLSRLELGRVRSVKDIYGFDISMQQIAWYRWKLQDEFSGDQSMMDQEFPFTEDDAFQSTGSKYYTAPVLNDITREARRYKLEAYRYRMTREWSDIYVEGPIRDPRSELKIWEHASKFGVYVISCDPAYGSSDQADNTCIQVWRAFAECLVQVAEFASRDVSHYQTAWIIAHLAGFYGKKESRIILEINGAGKAVFAELEHVRDHVRQMPSTGDNSQLKNCLNNMRYFYYSRPDTLSQQFAFHWITTDDNKRMIMAGLKDGIELSRAHPRSLALIDELRTMVNVDGSIAADGGKNDDRVMAAALAYEFWRKWLWGKLRGEGLTRARSMEIEARGGEQPIDRLVVNFLKKCNIEVPL